MKKLSINNPCTENWNEFTPNPEGGFCGSCAKIVIDFTNKSNQEISDILQAKAGENLCGRIGTTQLDNFNDTFSEWQSNRSNKGFQSRFLWALMLAFGLSLFSGQTITAQEILGKIAYTEQVDDSTDFKDSTIQQLPPPELHEMEVMGDMIIEDYHIADSTALDTTVQVEVEKCTKPESTIDNRDRLFTMGMMIVIEDDQKNETPSVKPLKPVKSIPKKPSIGKVYPNPSSSQATLFLDIQIEEQYTINIFSSDGKLCQTLSSTILKTGRYDMLINLEGYASGMYHISIVSNSHQSRISFVKN